MQFLALAALMGTLAAAAPAPHNPEVVVYEKAAVKTEIVTVAAPGETYTPTTYEQKDTTQSEQHVHHHHHDQEPAPTSSAPVYTPTYAAAPTSTPIASPSPSPSTSGTSTGSTGGTSSGGDSAPGDMAAVLKAHNDYRAKHSAPPLTWSADVASSAKTSNNNIKCPAKLTHTDAATLHTLNVGENLACGSAGMSLEGFVDMWYNENTSYNYGNGGFDDATGHFTQLVWKATTQLGCDFYSADGCAEPVLRCQYKTPGNYAGEYQQNVLPN